MDQRFLEFWGHFLLQAARGVHQPEDLARWMTGGYSGLEEINRLFRRIYGLEPAAGRSDGEPWQAAMASFQKACDAFAAQWGWVPARELTEVRTRCRGLEEKIARQAETIAGLRRLLDEKGLGHLDFMQRFNALIEDQSEEFQRLLDKIGPGAQEAERSSE